MLSSRAPGRVEFIEVRKPRKKPPTWVGASQRARSGLSTLRPPKLPSNVVGEGFVSDGGELEEFSPPPNRQGFAQEYPRGFNPSLEARARGEFLEEAGAYHDPDEYRREITPPPPRPGAPQGLQDGVELRAAMDAVMASVPPPVRPPVAELDSQALQDAALTELRAALEASLGLRDDWLRESEEQLVELVSVIARRVIAREVRSDPGLVRSLVREGIEALGGADRVVVRLGKAFSNAAEQLSDELESSGRTCQVLVDPELSEHGCVIETAYGRVDESLEGRLDQVLGALSPDEDD
ncbi:MAG: FliH/SctL family protein [Polyangiaceae bacterium]